MRIIVSAQNPKDVSVIDLAISEQEPDSDRVVLTFGSLLEVNLDRDELINALLALDGNYQIKQIRHDLNWKNT